ncbi:ABC transporter ATP-binding protein [Microbaculum marinisediminis]|uniref:ABC transporter ATP-binding protein n=1 Tax=Microbaculum marinisediminis TaxID=2931392 RepID=A0AAW5R1X0_9HYPH|nr:ABC transporter ATP-binding protein [Microbaculum sp. A6E488]MCT8974291.1 ABC transporter ATP-binding protein [Microbaculum sp. A6E488]
MTAAPILDVRDLSVMVGSGAGAPKVLDSVSFTLAKRKVLGVIGGSGSGKSVLAKAVVNWLDEPLRVASGQVLFENQDVLRINKAEMRLLRGKGIAYVGGNPGGALDPTMTVGAQIIEKLRAVEPGVSRAEARERAIELLEAVHIPSPAQRFDEYPFQYSGGMMQRAMIVDALISNPRLLVADSITQPLDVTVGAQILKLLRELTEKFGTAVLFISNSLPTAADVADDILVLDDGRAVEMQATSDLIASPRSDTTRELIDELPTLWTHDVRSRLKPVSGDQKPIMSVRDVSRHYVLASRALFGTGEKRVLKAVRNVDFDIYQSENFGIVGESGCGKSTLMRLLTALEKPDTGAITFEGTDIFAQNAAGLRAYRRKLQLVLQDPFNSLPPRSAIGAIIGEPLIIHGLASSGKAMRARVLEVMGEVGLPKELYEELPSTLTASQRQRVNVGRALILEPKVILMDETLSALGQTEQGQLLDLFERLQIQHNLTYIYISHDIAMVRRVCARVAVMYLGEVVELAHNERLFFDPGHPYSKALLSAAPTLEERRYNAADCLLEGEPPSPINLPVGCAFASRCPKAFDRCRVESPVLQDRGGIDRAACHLLDIVPATPQEIPA